MKKRCALSVPPPQIPRPNVPLPLGSHPLSGHRSVAALSMARCPVVVPHRPNLLPPDSHSTLSTSPVELCVLTS